MILIDELRLPPRISNCLKRSNIYTLWDLLNTTPIDLMKIEDFRIEYLIFKRALIIYTTLVLYA
ncbi:hypothetical protein C5H24_12485 [Xylella fastidiosa]|nr:hypothetical protein C5H24_12485 [Xylella fastidiosa]